MDWFYDKHVANSLTPVRTKGAQTEGNEGLTFVVIEDAGHMAPVDQKEAAEMVVAK